MTEILKYIVIITLIFILLNYIEKVYTFLKSLLSLKFGEIIFKLKTILYLGNASNRRKNKSIYKYFGLFEFEFENYDDKQGLKEDFCSTIEEKIKSKYKNIGLKLTATDKIFFNCADFSKLEDLIEDFLKLYSSFSDISKKRNIKTNLKFSIWTDYGYVNLQRAYGVLRELNSLSFPNQIVVNEKIYNTYRQLGLYKFNFNPCGLIKLTDNDNEELELYRLQKKHS